VDTSIAAVLWDFGGVILESPFDAFARYEEERDLPPGFLRRLNSVNPDGNAWARLERTDVTPEEFCELYDAEAAAAGHTIVASEVLSLLSGAIRPAMVEALRRCKAKLKTGLLTNNFVALDGTIDGATDRKRELGDVLALFDVIVESSTAGVRKPDPRFYELACQELDIHPAEAVFLDDLGINLRPARAMGMTTIKVVDPEAAIAELEAITGLDLRGTEDRWS
jgi:putative hydrolase of the HAD superfamily